MAMIGVGGDGSVQWEVEADNVRTSVSSLEDPRNSGVPRKVKHSGIDEASFDQDFIVSVKKPAGLSSADFLKACNLKTDRRGFTFRVRIQNETKRQLVIEWVRELEVDVQAR